MTPAGVPAALHPAKETRMQIAAAVGQARSRETRRTRPRTARPGARQRFVDRGFDGMRNVPPCRFFAEMFEKVERVVERAMTLRAELAPVLGVEHVG